MLPTFFSFQTMFFLKLRVAKTRGPGLFSNGIMTCNVVDLSMKDGDPV